MREMFKGKDKEKKQSFELDPLPVLNRRIPVLKPLKVDWKADPDQHGK